VVGQLKNFKTEQMQMYENLSSTFQNIWEEIIDNHPQQIFTAIQSDYEDMIHMVNRLDDYSGFQLIKEVKKNGVKIYILKEPGQRFITIKFTVDRIEIPVFNLISLLYETELYDLWFPFCKKSMDVINLSKLLMTIA